MKKLLTILALASLASVAASAGVLTSFNTTGVLSCGGNLACTGGGGSIVFSSGTRTLTIGYNSNSENNLNVDFSPNFSTTNFGTLTMTLGGSGDGSFNLAGATFALTANQTPNPFVASANFGTANFGGILSIFSGSAGGSAQVTFATTSQTTGPFDDGINVTSIQYNLNTQSFPANSYSLSLNNNTTLQGLLSATQTPSNVPEPSTYAMLGLGAVAFGMAYRRRKQ